MNEPMRQLISAYLDGYITAEQYGQLQGWLLADPRNVEEYVQEAYLHRAIRLELQRRAMQLSHAGAEADPACDPAMDLPLSGKGMEQEAQQLAGDSRDVCAGLGHELTRKSDDPRLAAFLKGQHLAQLGESEVGSERRPLDLQDAILDSPRPASRTWVRTATLAAASAVIVLILSLSVLHLRVRRTGMEPGNRPHTQESLPMQGPQLQPGWLRIEQGYARIMLDQGKEMVLQAPTTLYLESTQGLFRESGGAAAEVPGQGRSLTQTTSVDQVADAATESQAGEGAVGRASVQASDGTVYTAIRRRAIGSVERRNSENRPPVVAGPLREDSLCFTDRPHVFKEVPDVLAGVDYVKMTMDDKMEPAYEMDVNLVVPATLYLIICNRVGDESPNDPPSLGAKMQWVLDAGFKSTGKYVSIDEDADGSIDNYCTIYAVDVPAGKITLKEQNDGYVRAMYCVAAAARGERAGIAFKPAPSNGASDVVRTAALGWEPGRFAVTHNVYLGTSFTDVNTATPAHPEGVLVSRGQTSRTYAPAAPLVYGQPYYWRVDEVNGPPDYTALKGETWSFTVEPYAYPLANVTATASSASSAETGPERTIDRSGLNAEDYHGTGETTQWLSDPAAPGPAWIQYEFDHVYKLQEVRIWNASLSLEPYAGIAARNVTLEYATDANDWRVLTGVPEFAPAPGKGSHADDTTIHLGGIAASKIRFTIHGNWGGVPAQTGLSEVRFYYVPVHAREPRPATGSDNVPPDNLTLTWRAGRAAAAHEIYLGTDRQAVVDGTAAKVTTLDTREMPAVEVDRTYYWKVNEVNAGEPWPVWEGSVWSFSTPPFLVVDDFEGYANDSPKRVFQTWLDGAGFSPDRSFPNGHRGNGTGSIVGRDPAVGNIMETATVHGGEQSMPLFYSSTATARASEVTRVFDAPQDWARVGARTLVLHFYGDPANTAQELYAKINDIKVAYRGEARDVLRRRWSPWNVDLTGVPVATLRNVRTLTVGIRGGTGKLLVDDIQLHGAAPEIPAVIDPGSAGLVAYYPMDNSLQDRSGKGNDGTAIGDPVYAAGPAGLGTALRFDGLGDCVDLGSRPVFSFDGSFSLSLWANIGVWTANWEHVMLSHQGEGGLGWQLRRHNSNRVCFTARGVGRDNLASRMEVPVGQWIHIAAVYDNANNTKQVYINGIGDPPVRTTAGKVAAATHHEYIGARANITDTGPESFFSGLLDEVRIYDRALSSGEVEFLSRPGNGEDMRRPPPGP